MNADKVIKLIEELIKYKILESQDTDDIDSMGYWYELQDIRKDLKKELEDNE